MIKKGFTLIETLVAVSILSIAIAGSLFAANSTLVAASIARDKMIASYLAQESIERVRWVRDNYYLASYPTGDNPSAESGPAWINFRNAISVCSSSCNPTTLPLLGLDAVPAQFTRTLQITQVNDKDEKAISKVSWSYHGIMYSVEVTDHFTPWQ